MKEKERDRERESGYAHSSIALCFVPFILVFFSFFSSLVINDCFLCPNKKRSNTRFSCFVWLFRSFEVMADVNCLLTRERKKEMQNFFFCFSARKMKEKEIFPSKLLFSVWTKVLFLLCAFPSPLITPVSESAAHFCNDEKKKISAILSRINLLWGH